ncbi:hypothetical protein SAMN06273572_1154 [Monaibacterium marinum]|uniref:Uncharacterized protein n=1 Tax=Pontivivens marinum TaxID=1690039 RepID=A0A2C9CVZ3_9RHOB|nr:hypothetical protein SAMN06273572_1154 [Monaibacterium marinum]
MFCGLSGGYSGFDEVLQCQDGFGFEGRSPGFSALRSGGFDAVFGAFGNEATFKMRYGPENMEDQFTGGGCRVDPLFETDQSDTLGFQVFDGF